MSTLRGGRENRQSHFGCTKRGEGGRTAKPGEVAWLVEGEIPKATVTLLSGEPGSGKSFVACTLAASVSQVPDGRVIFAHSEPAERLRVRLVRAGAHEDRVTLLARGAGEGFGIQDSGFSKGMAARLDALIAWLSGTASARRVDLIVIDDIESWCGHALSATELAETAARLDQLARSSGAAVLAVVRSATTTEGRVTARALDRVMRAADVVSMVAADRDRSGRRWLIPLKNNLAALPRDKTFRIGEGRVEWLNQVPPDDAPAPGSLRSVERSDRHTAAAWLREALGHGDLPSKLLYAQARECGFSRKTILRAAHRMGIHARKSSFGGRWMFSLAWVPAGGRDEDGGAEGAGGHGSGGSGGFGIQDSAFSVPAAVGQAFQPDMAPAPRAENVEDCSKSPKTEGDRVQGTGDRKGFGIQGSGFGEGFRVHGAGFSTPEAPSDDEDAENCSKNPKSHKRSEPPNTNHQPPTTNHYRPVPSP